MARYQAAGQKRGQLGENSWVSPASSLPAGNWWGGLRLCFSQSLRLYSLPPKARGGRRHLLQPNTPPGFCFLKILVWDGAVAYVSGGVLDIPVSPWGGLSRAGCPTSLRMLLSHVLLFLPLCVWFWFFFYIVEGFFRGPTECCS